MRHRLLLAVMGLAVASGIGFGAGAETSLFDRSAAAYASKPSASAPLPEKLRATTAELSQAARSLGYTTAVTNGDFQTVVLVFAKSGKSEAGHGLLNRKWDERDTISITFIPEQDGLRVASSKRLVEQKAPIGEWKTVLETDQVPQQLLAGRPER